MKIVNNINSIHFNGLVPLKNYKGPTLKLTDRERLEINTLKEYINQLEIELYKLQKFYQGKKFQTQKANYFIDKEFTIKCKIEDYQNRIRNIKINNINAQKK